MIRVPETSSVIGRSARRIRSLFANTVVSRTVSRGSKIEADAWAKADLGDERATVQAGNAGIAGLGVRVSRETLAMIVYALHETSALAVTPYVRVTPGLSRASKLP